MSEAGFTQGRRPLVGRRNLIALTLALAALGVGYALLAAGGTSLLAVCWFWGIVCCFLAIAQRAVVPAWHDAGAGRAVPGE
jgi:hypothetical protein